jgi:hypothetical protein
MDQGKGVINKQPNWKRISARIFLVLLFILVIPLIPIILLTYVFYQIICGTWKREVLRFWEPFKAYKHGKEKPLKDLDAKLFRSLERLK